ncbi:MAG: hypothetical protein HY667_04185 [Chloroflexi bacterium]|nr:hypothetical protein [Chloroflexota bacterium]
MAVQDRVYKCLNPVGISLPVETHPLAPRLNTLDGKTIWLSITGEPDITIPLEKRLKSDYPNVNWKTKKTYVTHPVPLSEEEMKTCDALIQAICW